MLPRGRPPGPGTAEEKAAIRREKVRLNVKAYRERKKKALATSSTTSVTSNQQSTFLDRDLLADSDADDSDLENRHQKHNEEGQLIVRTARRPMAQISPSRSTDFIPSVKEATAVRLAPDSGSMFSLALLSAFRNAFLPPRVVLPQKSTGTSTLVTPCSPWIMNAYNMALQQDDGALRSGLLAIGLILNGSANNSSELTVASLQMHRQAIWRLHNDLGPIALRRQRNILVTNIFIPYLSCLAIAMFELIQNGFSPVILQHVKALNSLIELIYADTSVDRRTADLIVDDFGMFEMMFCLKYGLPSVLRETRRKFGLRQDTADSKTQPRRNASVYGDLLDVVDELPLLTIRTKTFQRQSISTLSKEKLRHVIEKLTRLQENLEAWKINFEIEHGSIMASHSFYDKLLGRDVTVPRLRSYEHGAVGLFLLNFRLTTIDTKIDAMTVLASAQEQYKVSIASLSQSTQARTTMERLDHVSIKADRDQTLSHTRQISETTGTDTLHEEFQELRMKARSALTQQIEVITQFAGLAQNICGQSFLINPCDKTREVLDKEQARLNADLHRLQPEDRQGASKINTYLQHIADARELFKITEFTMQQQFSSERKEKTS